MTTALAESPLSVFGEKRRLQPADGSESALEELLYRTLRSARAQGVAECPMCRARMHSVGDAARCSGCGSTLS
jgi:tRNA(Ile2) C34 agmatinyltransferase TiaS